MSKPKIRMVMIDDETYEFRVDGVYVGRVDHDEHGWAGIESARKLMKATAKAAGFKFEEIEEFEE